MKKITLVFAFALTICMSTSNVFAGPHGANLDNDVFGIAQGGGNILGVPTPKDDNDNPVGKELDINDAINLLLGTSYEHNSDVDFLQYTSQDSFWSDLTPDDNTGTFVFIGLTAANTNTLSIYDVTDPGTKVQVLPALSGFDFFGDGSAGDPFLAGYSPFAASTDFGWALSSNGTMWDSDPNKNPSGLDHMLTYQLSALSGQTVYIETCTNVANLATCTNLTEYTFNNPYLIAWEDKPCVQNNSGEYACGDQDFDDTIYLVDRVAPIVPEPASMLLLGSGLAGLATVRRRKQS